MKLYLNFNEKPRDKFWNFDSDEIESYTDFLFARPSFVEGLSRAFDIGNTLNNYNYSSTTQEADYQALKADWYTIGNDLRKAIYLTLQKHFNQQSYGGRKS